MIFALLNGMLTGVLLLCGANGRIEELRARVRDVIVDQGRKREVDLALDDAEKAIIGARDKQTALAQDLHKLLARPDCPAEELTAALERVDGEEALAFGRVVAARRRALTVITPAEWKLIVR